MSTTTNDNDFEVSSAHSSFESLLNRSSISDEVRNRVSELSNDTRLSSTLAAMRTKAGITQHQMAKHLKVTQSAISKLEMASDTKLTIHDIKMYTTVCKAGLDLRFGPPKNHVQMIRTCALEIQEHMHALAVLANKDEELSHDITKFFNEALINIFGILAECQQELPASSRDAAYEIKTMKIVSGSINKPCCVNSQDLVLA